MYKSAAAGAVEYEVPFESAIELAPMRFVSVGSGAPGPSRTDRGGTAAVDELADHSIPVSAWATSTGKRSLDLVLALVLLVPLLVVMAIVALVSTVAFRAWPFFVQKRVGMGGTLFRAIKVRSLPTSWHSDKGKHELDEECMPRVSHLLRGTHLDEIPQVLNVLFGQMSFVGPRPMIPGVLALLPPEVAEIRERVRPGVTGAWQVSTMGALPLHECTELDIVYVEHAGPRADAWLMWQTVRSRLRGQALEPDVVVASVVKLAVLDRMDSDVAGDRRDPTTR